MMKNLNKQSFILYLDSLEVISELSDLQVANLFRAIIAHQKGEEYQLSQIERIAFLPIKQYLERDKNKWTQLAEIRSNFGKKGAEKRWKSKPVKDKIAKIAKAILPIANDSKHAVNVNVNDNVNVNVYKKEIYKEKKSIEYLKTDDCRNRILEIFKEYEITDKQYQTNVDTMLDWLSSKGKVIKDYPAQLRNWIRKQIEFNKIVRKRTIDVPVKLKTQSVLIGETEQEPKIKYPENLIKKF